MTTPPFPSTPGLPVIRGGDYSSKRNLSLRACFRMSAWTNEPVACDEDGFRASRPAVTPRRA